MGGKIFFIREGEVTWFVKVGQRIGELVVEQAWMNNSKDEKFGGTGIYGRFCIMSGMVIPWTVLFCIISGMVILGQFYFA